MEMLYKREDYLNKIRGFYNDTMIKVITGIRRCGKSYLLKTIIEELKGNGVSEKDIIYIELDKKEYRNIDTPDKLEGLIEKLVIDNDFKYLFIDVVQNVAGFESVINAYREEGNYSIFNLLNFRNLGENKFKFHYVNVDKCLEECYNENVMNMSGLMLEYYRKRNS